MTLRPFSLSCFIFCFFFYFNLFSFISFILIYFHFTFQLRSCAGISRSRCFLQPSIWMKMLISNSRLLQEKWAHKVVVAEECSIHHCCSVDLKEWLNTIQYVHEILPMLLDYWQINCKLWFKPLTLKVKKNKLLSLSVTVQMQYCCKLRYSYTNNKSSLNRHKLILCILCV